MAPSVCVMGVGAKRHGGWRERKEGLCWSRVTDVSELSSGTVKGARGEGEVLTLGAGWGVGVCVCVPDVRPVKIGRTLSSPLFQVTMDDGGNGPRKPSRRVRKRRVDNGAESVPGRSLCPSGITRGRTDVQTDNQTDRQTDLHISCTHCTLNHCWNLSSPPPFRKLITTRNQR